MLALSTAVGNLGTSPVSKNSSVTGIPNESEISPSSRESSEKKKKGRSSLVNRRIVDSIRAPSR